MTAILRLLSSRVLAIQVRTTGLVVLLATAFVTSIGAPAHAAGTPSPARPPLTLEQRRQLAEAVQDQRLAPWQRDFMAMMSSDEQAIVAEGERSASSRAIQPQRTTSADGTWIEEPMLVPDLRSSHTAIYDPMRDRMIVSGGSVAGDREVWALSLGILEWTQLTPSGTPPSARNSHSAIYDPVRDRMVLFGGVSDVYLNDVWALSLADDPQWTQLTPAGTPPSPRRGHTAIYDPVRDRMVVFGGYNSVPYLGDVWALTLAGSPTWTPLAPSGTPPHVRTEHTAIYDPVRDRMVVFGGCYGSMPYEYLNDVWALSLAGGTAWTQITPPGLRPGERHGHSAIYDSASDCMVVYGGAQVGLGTVWSFSLGSPAWTELTSAGTPAPFLADHTAIYDPVRDRMVVYGGGEPFPEGDVWVMSPPAGNYAWTRVIPAPLAPPTAVSSPIYDPVRDRMVVFRRSSEVWTFSPANPPSWAHLVPSGTPPGARVGSSVIYDPIRDRIVMFGGYVSNSGQYLNEVWTLSLAGTPAWTQLHPVSGDLGGGMPWERYHHSAIYDPVRDRMVVFGGSAGSNPYNALNDIWGLSLAGTPTWTQVRLSGIDQPPGRYNHGAIYDPVRQRMVLFGGRNNSGMLNDVWTLSMTNGPTPGIPITPDGPLPLPREVHAAIYDPVLDRMVVYGGFGGTQSFGTLNDIWALGLAGTPTWQQLAPSGTPPPTSAGQGSAYDPVRDRMVVFGVEAGLSVWDLWWNPLVGVPSRGGVSDWLSAYPNPSRNDVTIAFTLQRPSAAALRIYDLSGRLVKTLVEGDLPAGSHRVLWDRRFSSGAPAPSGSYFYELRVDGQKVARRIVLIE